MMETTEEIAAREQAGKVVEEHENPDVRDWEASQRNRNSAKVPLQNYCFKYRGINHVESPRNWSDKRAFEDAVIEKYRKMDAGEYERKVRPDPKRDLRTDFDKLQSTVEKLDASEPSPSDEIVANQAQITELIRLNAELRGQVVDAVEMLKKHAPPETEPETKATIGPGECPKCHREFKRLDLHGACRAVNGGDEQ